jgi:VIT1/CCC1 family predicted Fe2+/Mn2+ transporter
MVVGALSNANYANSYSESLKKRKSTGVMLSMGGLTTIVGSSYIKNNWVGLALLAVGAISGLVGMIDYCKADKELKNLESKQKLNTEI